MDLNAILANTVGRVIKKARFKANLDFDSIGLAILIDYNFSLNRFAFLMHFLALGIDIRLFF